MIRYTLPLLLVLLSTAYAQAQDTLTLRNGREHIVKVLEINPTEVAYKRFDNLDGPLIVVLKADVLRIVYANGTSEEFQEELPRAQETPIVRRNDVATPTAKPATAVEMYNQGRMDAITHYKGRGAMWGTFAATLYPPAGLLTGFIVGAVPPNPKSFYTSNPKLLENPAYVKGYKEQAHRRKIGKAVAGFGMGLGAWICLALIAVGPQ